MMNLKMKNLQKMIQIDAFIVGWNWEIIWLNWQKSMMLRL